MWESTWKSSYQVYPSPSLPSHTAKQTFRVRLINLVWSLATLAGKSGCGCGSQLSLPSCYLGAPLLASVAPSSKCPSPVREVFAMGHCGCPSSSSRLGSSPAPQALRHCLLSCLTQGGVCRSRARWVRAGGHSRCEPLRRAGGEGKVPCGSDEAALGLLGDEAAGGSCWSCRLTTLPTAQQQGFPGPGPG